MKIAIFGYPRSGTTMLGYIISQHLASAGVVKEWANLGEVFNPLEGTQLLVSPSHGHLVHITNLISAITQPREERLQLFKEHMDDDYIIKILSYDTAHEGVVGTVMGANYNIMAIERRNPLSAYLSVLIAYHHRVWHVFDSNYRPVYEPFEVSEQEMIALGKSLAIYHHYRDQLNPSAILYYEDIVEQSITATLKQAGVYHEGAAVEDTPTKKLLSFEEKIKLIINFEEVVNHLTGILTPYMITMEHNNL